MEGGSVIETTTPDYITTFARAVYGKNAELAMASFDQRKFIVDATLKIERLSAVAEAAKAAFSGLPDTPYVAHLASAFGRALAALESKP